MLGLCMLAVTALTAAKVAAIALACGIGIYILFCSIMIWGTNKWGLEFLGFLIGISRIVFFILASFGVLFLLVLGIGALI